MSVALDVLMKRAIGNPSAEPAFFWALLSAELFFHCPRAGDHDRLRIVQFTRPDGLQVIPVFTDLQKAVAASSLNVEIVSLNGRALFEATRGATFMLNPNDTSCTLYPEEVADLLSDRPIARAPVAGSALGLEVQAADEDDRWIGKLAAESLKSIEPVAVLYQLKARKEDCTDPSTVLLVLSVPEQYAERAARAVTARLEANVHRLSTSVDLTHFDPSGSMPEWLVPFADMPIWRREKMQ